MTFPNRERLSSSCFSIHRHLVPDLSGTLNVFINCSYGLPRGVVDLAFLTHGRRHMSFGPFGEFFPRH